MLKRNRNEGSEAVSCVTSPVFTRILILAEVLASLPDTLQVGKRIRAKSLVSAKSGTVRSDYEGTHSASVKV